MRTKKIIGIGLTCAIFIAVYMLASRNEEQLLRGINALSYCGVFNICAALLCHVRNSGQFRLFGYAGYARHKKTLAKDIKDGALPDDTETPGFIEYSQKRYEKKWDPAPFYICGAPLLLLSLALIPLLK